MRILVVHNYYQQPGGEDTTVKQETRLLREQGHTIIDYRRSNRELMHFNLLRKAMLPLQAIWASDTYQQLCQLIQQERPDVAHFHNTHFMISPAAYYACQASNIPVVQTIQNYRLLCPSATFFRDGHVCEDCMGKIVPWPSIVHACYRESRLQTGMVAATLVSHRFLNTWQAKVDMFIVPTEFVRQKLVEGGLHGAKIVVKPNFVYPDPGQDSSDGGYALFVGRLTLEKGIETLIDAWRQLGGIIPLRIVGDGTLSAQVAAAAQDINGIEWLGQLPKEQVLALMKQATVLIFPSIWYEAFPLVIVEAYATGLPVIASKLGSMETLIKPQYTGLHFEPGNAEDLAVQVRWLLSHQQQYRQMRQQAYSTFKAHYTGQHNYEMLMDIYQSVI
jgi:glycosyltransferase involved in cell wall biosynthesis